MNSSAIIIPIYKNEITHFESISLQQCFKVFENYKIIFVAPQKLKDSSFYKKYSNRDFLFFKNQNFTSIVSYNHMLLSDWFYREFEDYTHILIYQLDSYVFKDELSYWTKKKYSYVGAPWFADNSNDNSVSEFMGVGNGGFSLRNVQDSIKVLTSNVKIRSLKEHIINNKNSNKSFYVLRGIKHYLNSPTFKTIKKNKHVNEDKMFFLAAKRFKDFKIPLPEEALEFSFEKQPSKLYEMNNKQLPFGCHAWWTYDLGFYRSYIEKDGYNLSNDE